jgi:hypothetical protein
MYSRGCCSMPSKFPRINLLVPSSIAERLRREASFLHIRSRVKMEDGTELQSVAGLVRWVADLYIDLCDAGGAPTYEWEETEPVPFTLDSGTKGRWDYALKYHHFASYHELAGNALTWYFGRVDQRVAADQHFVEYLKTLSPTELLTQLRKNHGSL